LVQDYLCVIMEDDKFSLTFTFLEGASSRVKQGYG